MMDQQSTLNATDEMPSVVVAALYRFAPLPDFAERRDALLAVCEDNGLLGTLLLASEGVNGTIAGSRQGIDAVIAHLRAFPGFGDLDVKESGADVMPFNRMKVRLKSEIVSMGCAGVDPTNAVGTYVEPRDWNELISRDDVLVIDTRNDYEIGIGTFENAVNPETDTFRSFPSWIEQNLDARADTKVAMFCTGGIRCEKATALLKDMGFEDVFHLKGGILKYLETVPERESLWRGECFVFDQRVSVGHGLQPGPYQLCSICRKPFNSGTTGGYADAPCQECEVTAPSQRKARAAARQRQIEISEAKGESHVGRQPSRKRGR